MKVCCTPFSHWRMQRLASTPSITGIWRSINTTSYFWSLIASKASNPLETRSTRWPSRLSSNCIMRWFKISSSTTRIFSCGIFWLATWWSAVKSIPKPVFIYAATTRLVNHRQNVLVKLSIFSLLSGWVGFPSTPDFPIHDAEWPEKLPR